MNKKLLLELSLIFVILSGVYFVAFSAHQGYWVTIECDDGQVKSNLFYTCPSNGFFNEPGPYELCIERVSQECDGDYKITESEPANIQKPIIRLIKAVGMSGIVSLVLLGLFMIIRLVISYFKK